jgi:cyclopropane-fatty-acyl-phospholipid synthase
VERRLAFGADYAETLRRWRAAFLQHEQQVREQGFDERFVRSWRLYLAGSIAGFTTGSLQLFQVVFAPRHNNDLPQTRARLYAR